MPKSLGLSNEILLYTMQLSSAPIIQASVSNSL